MEERPLLVSPSRRDNEYMTDWVNTYPSSDQMVYTRGSSEDYDLWANITDDAGWSWDSLQKYIRKVYSSFHSLSGLSFIPSILNIFTPRRTSDSPRQQITTTPLVNLIPMFTVSMASFQSVYKDFRTKSTIERYRQHLS